MIRPYSQLARRMVLVALLIALVPLNVVGSGIYFYFQGASRENLKEEMLSRATNRGGAIALFLAERTSLIEVLARSGKLAEIRERRALTNLFQVLNRRAWSFVDLGVINAQGDQICYVGPYPLENRNYREAEWFELAMERGVYISDVFMGIRNVPHFVIAVKHEGDDEPWVLRATIDSDVFNRLVRSVQVGRSGDAYIVDSKGRLQTPSRFGGEILSPSGLDVSSIPPGKSVLTRTNGGGNTVFSAFTWIPTTDWLLVVDQDPSEVLAPLNLALRVGVAVLVTSNLLIVAAVLLLVRLLVRQLRKNDRERAALDANLAHSARLVSLGRMAAGVAHEINNPLAAIGERTAELEDLLDPAVLKQTPDGELCLGNLVKIQGQVERVRDVTQRMLKFARRMEPHLEELDLNAVVKESFAFVGKEASFQNISVELELDPSLPAFKGDRAQMQQVLLNIMSNAFDAAGQGGRVVIATARAGDFLEVRVTDSGPGIPREMQDRVFDPFFTTKAPGEGTGLGLSISHSIMRKLGGELTFRSPPGEGATFTARFPRFLPPPDEKTSEEES